MSVLGTFMRVDVEMFLFQNTKIKAWPCPSTLIPHTEHPVLQIRTTHISQHDTNKRQALSRAILAS